MNNDDSHSLIYRLTNTELKKYHPPIIHPFEWRGIQFFIHRSIDIVADGNPVYSKAFWGVTSKDTGMALPIENAMTIDDARQQAVEMLEKVGLEKVKEAISRGKVEVKP